MEVRVTTENGNIIKGKVSKMNKTLVSLENVTIEQVAEIGDFEVFMLHGETYYAIVFKENVKKIDVI